MHSSFRNFKNFRPISQLHIRWKSVKCKTLVDRLWISNFEIKWKSFEWSLLCFYQARYCHSGYYLINKWMKELCVIMHDAMQNANPT